MDCAHEAPLCMGFPRQEYWSGLPFPNPGDLPDPGIKPTCLASSALTGGFFITVLVSTYCIYINICIYHHNCLNFMKRGYRGKGSPLVKLRDPPQKRKQVWPCLCITVLSCSAHTLGILMIWHHRELYTKIFLWHSFYKLFGRGRV